MCTTAGSTQLTTNGDCAAAFDVDAGERVSARLIVRRVRRLDSDAAPAGEAAQGELFAAYRLHVGTFTGPTGLFRQRTELSTTQRDLLATLDITAPTR